MDGSQAMQILRTIDKHDKIGTAGVVELLQKSADEFGAGIDAARAALFGQFLECRGEDNNETIRNIKEWFARAPIAMRRLRVAGWLESINSADGRTRLDDLIDMPVNDDGQWIKGCRPSNIGWALDDIAETISRMIGQKGGAE